MCGRLPVGSKMSAKAVVVAGTHSGCGKTTVALGLMAALSEQGLRVKPFKVGPDFIDPGHHAAAAGCVGENLDGWMLSRRTVADIYSRCAFDADVAVIEGVMGLFDGFSGSDEAGSTAQLAKWLGAPVLLVVDARSMARSAAAVVQGFFGFDPDVKPAGVLFNNVGSDSHRRILEEAMSSSPHIPVLGCLPRRDGLASPSRHLGLVTADDAPMSPEKRSRLARWMEANADLPALLELLPHAETLPQPAIEDASPPTVRIGLARDKAFCFYYEENLRLLRRAGAEIVPFSPLDAGGLPENLDGLYLGGGYPELHAETLSANTGAAAAVRAFAASGRSVYAECGGFMYLMESLVDEHGACFPMAGVFPFSSIMGRKRFQLGYREVTTTAAGLLGPKGTTARGHEFHYSSLAPESLSETTAIYAMRGRAGAIERSEGFTTHNVLGSYVHLHFASNPALAPAFVYACRAFGDRGACP